MIAFELVILAAAGAAGAVAAVAGFGIGSLLLALQIGTKTRFPLAVDRRDGIK